MKKIAVVWFIVWSIFLVSSCIWEEKEENKVEEKKMIEQNTNNHSNNMDGNMEKNKVMIDNDKMNNNSINWIDLYNYVVYSESAVRDSKKLKVLFFNDDNVEGIKTLKSNLQESKIHDWLVMYQIDFNSDSELKNKYGVTKAHTFVQVDEELNIIRKWEWSKTIEQMHTQLTNPLNIVKAEKDIIKSEWVYTDYSEETFAWAKWDIVLYFHADWCPACKTANKNFLWEKTPDNLTLLKIDYDNSTELKKKYLVTSQHTFVQVDNEWNMINKWSGSKDSAWILKKLK